MITAVVAMVLVPLMTCLLCTVFCSKNIDSICCGVDEAHPDNDDYLNQEDFDSDVAEIFRLQVIDQHTLDHIEELTYQPPPMATSFIH